MAINSNNNETKRQCSSRRVSIGLVITIFFIVVTILWWNRAKLTLWPNSQSWNWVKICNGVGENWVWTLATFIQAKRTLSNQKKVSSNQKGANFFLLILNWVKIIKFFLWFFFSQNFKNEVVFLVVLFKKKKICFSWSKLKIGLY